MGCKVVIDSQAGGRRSVCRRQYYICVLQPAASRRETAAVDKQSGNAPTREARADAGWLAGLVLLMLGSGAALSIDVVPTLFGIKGDEATYVSMALSAAHDLDLSFAQEDVERFWSIYRRGPEGIFLKTGKRLGLRVEDRWPFLNIVKAPDGQRDRLYYGKAFIYPVIAAPFVRLAGLNGLLLFHVVLIWGVFLGSYAFVRARSPASAATVYALAFLFASIAPLYLIWLTPEVFNFALVFYAYFLWLYKEVAPTPSGSRGRWLRSGATDLVAAVLIGLVTYSKPLNLPLIAPMVLLAWYRRRFAHGLAIGAIAVAVTAAAFGVNAAVSGEFNYQGGDRKTFYGSFPFDSPGATFENRGIRYATDDVKEDVLFEREVFWPRLRDNIYYFFAGRHAGLMPYYFPALVALWLWARDRRNWHPWQVLIVGVVVMTCAVLILWLPFTWAGGGGPPGNRYFLNLYPALLFITPPIGGVRPALAAFAGGAIFTAHILINPFVSSTRPWLAPRQGLLHLLPIEMTMVNDLPIMINSGRGRVPYGQNPRLLLYFLDDNAWLPESAGIWVAGHARTEIIVRTGEYLSRLEVKLQSLVPNTVTLSAGHETKTVHLEAGSHATVSLVPKGSYSRQGVGHLLTVRTTAGAVPRFATPGSTDGRFLGVLMQLSATPRDAAGAQ